MARPFIPVADVYKCEMRFTQYGQKIENVLYVHQHEPFTPVSMDGVGSILVLWYTTNMVPRVVSGLSLNEIKITDMSAVDAPTESFTTDLPVVGSYGDSGLPSNVTLAVKLCTQKRGRSFTGRQFICGIPDGSNDGNQITTAALGFFKAAYEALVTDLSTGGVDLSVVSFVHNKALRTEGIATPVTSITIDPNLDSQRRRLTGRGK